MGLHLVIGNKNYSSWSMRPWIGMRATGIAFDETVISLNAPDFKPRLVKLSGTGKVPVLIDGDIRVWESLAILEYCAEKFPQAGLWPADAAARAHARAISHEMHAGFIPLRRHCPMNLWRPVRKRHLTADAAANVKRIDAMWSDCAARFGGPVPVRKILRRRRHVCARGVAAAHLCGQGERGVTRLYGRHDGAAGLGRVDQGGARGGMGAGGR